MSSRQRKRRSKRIHNNAIASINRRERGGLVHEARLETKRACAMATIAELVRMMFSIDERADDVTVEDYGIRCARSKMIAEELSRRMNLSAPKDQRRDPFPIVLTDDGRSVVFLLRTGFTFTSPIYDRTGNSVVHRLPGSLTNALLRTPFECTDEEWSLICSGSIPEKFLLPPNERFLMFSPDELERVSKHLRGEGEIPRGYDEEESRE